jgi:ATP-dependent protease HslVU (ClpYQ) ATPase subunit
VNIAQIHANCEKAIAESESMQNMMELMMDTTNESMAHMEGAQADDLVSDDEIDRMIDEEIVAEEADAMDEKMGSRLDQLRERFEKSRAKEK